MGTTLGSTGITFNDATVQTTAAAVASVNGNTGAITASQIASAATAGYGYTPAGQNYSYDWVAVWSGIVPTSAISLTANWGHGVYALYANNNCHLVAITSPTITSVLNIGIGQSPQVLVGNSFNNDLGGNYSGTIYKLRKL